MLYNLQYNGVYTFHRWRQKDSFFECNMCTHVWLYQWLSGCDPRQLILKFLQSQKYFVIMFSKNICRIFMDFDGFSAFKMAFYSDCTARLFECRSWRLGMMHQGEWQFWERLVMAFEHWNGIKWPYQNHEDIEKKLVASPVLEMFLYQVGFSTSPTHLCQRTSAAPLLQAAF